MFQVEVMVNVSSSVATDGLVAFFYLTADNLALAVGASNGVAAGDQVPIPVQRTIVRNTSNTIAFQVNAGGSAAGTTTFNGRAAGRLYAGTMGSFIKVTEIAA